MSNATYYSMSVSLIQGKAPAGLASNAEDTLLGLLRAGFPDARRALEHDGCSARPTKWFDHEKHLQSFSKTHPYALFSLHGECESGNYEWTKYFVNGHMNMTEVRKVEDEFDDSLLQYASAGNGDAVVSDGSYHLFVLHVPARFFRQYVVVAKTKEEALMAKDTEEKHPLSIEKYYLKDVFSEELPDDESVGVDEVTPDSDEYDSLYERVDTERLKHAR